jgi:predicted ester cyclase
MGGAFRAGFSTIRATVDDQVADGDEVAWRWTFQSTHGGEFMGIPPTGKRSR